MRLPDETYEFIKGEVVALFERYDVRCIPINGFELAIKLGIKLIPYSALSARKLTAVMQASPDGLYIETMSGKDKRKRTGMAQAWFPKSWSDKDIRRAGDHVASLKANRHAPDGKPIFGIYKGVRVGVIKTNGTPGTIFPDYDQSAAIRKRRKH